MDLQIMINLLQEDMQREIAHWNFYTHAGNVVAGLHREEMQEFFYKQADQESKHVREFAQLILGLTHNNKTPMGIPYTPHTQTLQTFAGHLQGKNMYEILERAIAMEKEVVVNYVERMDQARELGGVDGQYIEIFLEDQILDSRSDVDHMQQMLA